mmetsp:Transcript_21266/g.60009  ORF Transcript_21266/g.60009 Transcript_21266/m.60009 type:complete len:253 (+) Transcript_21266:150-908(+)
MGTVRSMRLAAVAMTRLWVGFGFCSTGTPGDAGVAGRSSDARSTRKLSCTSLPTDHVSVGYLPSGKSPRGTLREPSDVDIHSTSISAWLDRKTTVLASVREHSTTLPDAHNAALTTASPASKRILTRALTRGGGGACGLSSVRKTTPKRKTPELEAYRTSSLSASASSSSKGSTHVTHRRTTPQGDWTNSCSSGPRAISPSVDLPASSTNDNFTILPVLMSSSSSWASNHLAVPSASRDAPRVFWKPSVPRT